jgi:hypothetical protein
MPPTAQFALRGERLGLQVLTAGPVRCFHGLYPTGSVDASPSSDRAGVPALILWRGANRRDGKGFEDHDPEARGLRGAHGGHTIRDRGSPACLVGDRCLTPSERPASGWNEGRPGPVRGTPRRVSDAILRLRESPGQVRRPASKLLITTHHHDHPRSRTRHTHSALAGA